MLSSCFFFSSRRRHTRYWRDWSSDVCSSDLLGRRRGKPLAIVPRRNLQGTQEGEAHLLFATEPALFSDGGDSVLSLFKPTTSCIQSNCFDRLGRCATALLSVDARKVSVAHVNPLGELLDCNVPL